MGTAGTLGLFTVHSWYFGAFQRAQLALRGLFRGHSWHFGGFTEGTAGTLEASQRTQLAPWMFYRGHSWHRQRHAARAERIHDKLHVQHVCATRTAGGTHLLVEAEDTPEARGFLTALGFRIRGTRELLLRR